MLLWQLCGSIFVIFSAAAHQPRIGHQSEHERYLTEKYAKKPVIVMNYPKDIKAFFMRVNDDDRTVTARNGSKCWTGA